MNTFFSNPFPAPTPKVADSSLDTQPREEEWSGRKIALATLTAFAVLMGFLLLYRFYMAVFLLFTAFALQVAFQPLIEVIHRRGIRREIGVFLVYALLFLAVFLLAWFIAPIIIDQARAVINDLPLYYQDLRNSLTGVQSGLLRGLASTLPAQISLSSLASLLGSPNATGSAAESETSQGWQTLYTGSRTLFAFFAVLALAFYWTLERELILRKLVMRSPTEQRDQFRLLIAEIQLKIGAYFRGQLILCLIIGVVSTLAFLLIGVPNALVLGLLMGIFEALPVIGPTLGAVPAILMTLGSAPERALWVVLALVAIQAAENNFLVPRVMDRSVGVNAVVSILAIAAFGALFGIIGAILAIPLAAIVQILLNRLLFNAPLADEAPPSLLVPATLSRGHLGLLRLQAQEIAHDIRKQARAGDTTEMQNQEVEEVEDEIEMLAVDLDSFLAQLETIEIETSTKTSEVASDVKAEIAVPVLAGQSVQKQSLQKESVSP